MTPSAWVTLLATFAVAISTPGPDLFMLMRLGLRSRRAAVLAAFGIMTGNTIWTLASILGLSALLRTMPAALPLLQLLGSGVLIWLGAQSIRGGVRSMRESRAARRFEPVSDAAPGDEPRTAFGDSDDGARIATSVTRHPLRLGLLTNLSNPKALLFFTALFSQILPSDASWFDRAAILLAMTAVGLAWFAGFALLASSAPFQRWFGRAAPAIDVLAGIVFLIVAGAILVELALRAV